ncbi:MAG: helix-turn-helix transcriptional regulator [Bacteroidetes bacterium]|nr:helix-turn-helix transcriptional regulator [Bacteroidota bacterium]
MPPSSNYTLTNPATGNLLFKIYGFRDDNPFDHLQRLSYYTIILLTEGNATLHADFTEHEIGPASLLFFSPYQPFMLGSTQNIQGSILHFHSDFFCIHQHQREVACNGILFNNIYQEPILTLSETDLKEFQHLLDEIKPEITRTDLAQHELLVSYLKIFLIRASRLKTEQAPISSHRPQADLAQHLRDAIEQHYKTIHSPSGYAALLHVTPKALARIAKIHFNKTPTNLITERIIIEAKRELYLSSKTIKEIAYTLGFDDEFYFSRFFKNNADVSPQLFRETVGFARAEHSPSSN